MMWIGLWLSLGPINAAYGLVSVVGNARQFVIGGAMLALAVCLSLLTLLVSAVAHNVVVLVIALVAAAVSAGYGIRKWVRAATGAPSTEQHDTLSLSDHGFEQQENAAANAPAGNSGTASGQIRFACEICNKRYVVPASIAGRKVRCKECGHKFHVPMKSSSKM
jgi:DNA-directed RNA polymerase subunit RPC12/RpoP